MPVVASIPTSPRPRHERWSTGWLIAAVFGLFLLSERSALAYIDPGSGSLIYQALLAGLLGLGFAFRRTTETIKSFMRGRFGGRDVSSEKANPDHR
ncbi:MAG: hypothetical protein ABL993_08475 [Vicinamibacterales bacterium]